MGLVFDLVINRECENCVHGEYDLLQGAFFCNLRGDFRPTDDSEKCPDAQTEDEDAAG
ncbi:MAG: hypothetical protein FWE40_05575 [Oscillospiraceae bacterium]|nr:hypothetical protein [Oscillospiraceae bacterium]